MNQIENIYNEIFKEYFNYQNPSFLIKHLDQASQVKNEKIVNQINGGLIDLGNDAIKKTIPENENADKVTGIVEKIIDFNKYQKGKGLRVSSLRQMLQRLPIVFAQVKAGNTSENVPNEIHQKIYFLY